MRDETKMDVYTSGVTGAEYDAGMKQVFIMATNPPSGDGHRNGMVRQRSQTYNSKTQQYVKRDTITGRFIDVKQDGTPFKGVRKEK